MQHPSPARTTGPAGVTRRRFLVGAGATAGIAPFVLPGIAGAQEPDGYGGGPSGRAFGFPAADMTSRIVKDITFPADGNVSWTDTYGACRSGCSRAHEGQDIIGPKLTKLVACVSGTVVALRHESGGNSLYLKGDDGWFYAYLHINNDSPGTDDGRNPYAWAFAPGVTEGGRVYRGQHVAWMGDSGNAESTTSHLHFEIRKPASSVWNAQAINPKYSLDAATPAPPAVPASTFAPWDNADDLIERQYRDFLGRAPDDSGLTHYRGLLTTGQRTPAWFIESVLGSADCQGSAGMVFRLYRAYFLRDPDLAGYMYWLSRARTGMAPHAISSNFEAAGEFKTRYGALTDAQFVDTVYQNVLGRSADPGGRAYWIDQLGRKLISRGRLMLRFSESEENVRNIAWRTTIVLVHAHMVRRMPTDAAVNTWLQRFWTGESSPQGLIDTFRKSTEYKNVIASGRATGAHEGAPVDDGADPVTVTKPATATAG